MHQLATKRRGRGAVTNRGGRYEAEVREASDDGWSTIEWLHEEEHQRTEWRRDSAKSVISRNNSPDLHFDQSINPYRGCEHGCIYCFARPSHTYLGHSAGLDFERLLYVKEESAKLLSEELDKPGYKPEPLAVGVNTDAWQPLERKLGITRAILTVLRDCKHPCYLITKSSLIERDIDILEDLAREQLVTVSITITTLDNSLARTLEPRATAPHRRLLTIKRLAEAGIPVRVSISPIIPALNEMEIETIVARSADAGAECAWAIPLRLSHELPVLFEEWLDAHYPLKKSRVLNGVRDIRGGDLNDSRFGFRMSGSGPRADLIAKRLAVACRRAGIACGRHPMRLDSSRFKPPRHQRQVDMFD